MIKNTTNITMAKNIFNLEEPVRVASPTRINLEEPVRVASPTRISLEKPSGYPAQPGLTWRNQFLLVTQPRINLEEPISSGYPAHLGLTWRNSRLPSSTRTNLEEPISSGYPAQTGLTWRNQFLLVTQPKQD
jgi:hypothetical protein